MGQLMSRMWKLLDTNFIQSESLRRLVPGPLKRALKHRVPYADYRSAQLRREAERRFGGPIPIESDYPSPHRVTLGVFRDNSYTYAFNVKACIDLKVRFKVVDLAANDWIDRVVDSGCDAFLATPSTLLRLWHRMNQERLWVVSHDMERRLCPTFEELYLWESKYRMRDWLDAHEVPHPETWVFFDKEQAMGFCRATEYPVVAKTDSGAASNGIFVLGDQRAAVRLINRAFSEGLLPRSADAREREQGSILFQQYVHHDHEWRVVRIGDDFLCRRKVRLGEFASGSGNIGWAEPLPGMLEFGREVTDAGGFRHIALDIFEDSRAGAADRFLVNELQAIVGFREVPVNENMGRWRRDHRAASWTFEHGCFHQNACANLRVKMLLQDISTTRDEVSGIDQ